MSLVHEQAAFLQDVADLIRKAKELDLVVTAGELYRTHEQQVLYYRRGRSRTLNSQHMKRLAIDLNFFERGADGALQLVSSGPAITQLGAWWEDRSPSNRWGGSWTTFKDPAHFERREG